MGDTKGSKSTSAKLVNSHTQSIVPMFIYQLEVPKTSGGRIFLASLPLRVPIKNLVGKSILQDSYNTSQPIESVLVDR